MIEYNESEEEPTYGIRCRICAREVAVRETKDGAIAAIDAHRQRYHRTSGK